MISLRAKSKVLDRIVLARKLGGRYHAEADGLLRSLYGPEPMAGLFSDPELQAAYESAFREGLEIQQVEDGLARQVAR